MHVVEWAEFSLNPGVSEAELLTAAAMVQQQFLQGQDGYLSRQLLSLTAGRYVDMVVWKSREAADIAIAGMGGSQICRTYFSLMRVDSQPSFGTPLLKYGGGVDSVGGMEFSLFRLRPGVQEHRLTNAARLMAETLYHGEPGFHTHMLMRRDENSDLFADVVLADSAEQARALCGKWGQGPFHPACMDYLDLIEPESVKLEFWNRVG